MRIDPKIEDATRTMLEHAVRGDPERLSEAIRSIGDDRRFRDCLGLCVAIAGYIAVDVLGPEWPSDDGLREMARAAVRSRIPYELDEAQVHAYLEKCAVGFQPLERAFATGEEMTTWPIVFTASLLLTFCPRNLELWEYLEQVEGGLEAADSLKEPMLPAAILRAHRIKAAGHG